MDRFKLMVLALPLLSLVPALEGQRVQEIRVQANAEKVADRFTPPLICARPGDVLLVRAGQGVPHSIVFESRGMAEATQEAMNGAMPRRIGDLSSALRRQRGGEDRTV